MKVLETRRKDGLKWRRYRTDDGRTLTTYELPTTVVRNLGLSKALAALHEWERGEAVRARAWQIRQRVIEGVKPAAIAHEFGVTEERVRQVRRKLRDELRNKTAGTAKLRQAKPKLFEDL